MIRKNLMKSLSVIMAAMMAIMTVACGSNTVDTTAETAVEMAAEEEAGEDPLANTVVSASNIASAESEAGKVETVYVTADANGAVNDVIVSEWLKNAAASPEIADTTELKDIVNVKGEETFTDNGDGTVTWNANGSDIYYQGTTNKQLPVNMKITYTLDGKEITPEELAGKSGKVTIRFEYENNDKQTVEVNGKEVDVYTPFAMVSGMMLDSDKFTNVEISNGKVISDGGNIIVMGVALPGLKESLDISDDKWDELEDADEIKDKLSNSFEITADTTDFELGMTITMASSDILSDFGMTDLSGSDKLDDLKSDMEDLNDGSNKLVDGTKELKDGTKEFADGTKKLYDGATELKDGTQKLYDGTGSLVDGTGKLSDGAGTLSDGIGKYTDGVSKVNDGAKQLADGANTLKAGTSTLRKGMEEKKLVENAQALAQGSKDVSDAVSGLGSIASGITPTMTELLTEEANVKKAYNYLLQTGGVSWDEALAGMKKITGNDNITQEEIDNVIRDAAKAEEAGVSLGNDVEDIYDTVISYNPANYGDNEEDVEIKTIKQEDYVQPSENNNEGTPTLENNNEVAPASETNNGGAPASENNNGGAPASENNNGGAPASENNNGGAPASENNNGGAPASENNNGVAPASENNNEGTPAPGNNIEGTPAPVNSDNAVPNLNGKDQTKTTVTLNTGDLLGFGAEGDGEFSAADAIMSMKIQKDTTNKTVTLDKDDYATLLGYVQSLAGSASDVKKYSTAAATYAAYKASAQGILGTIDMVKKKLNLTPEQMKQMGELPKLISGAQTVAGGNALLSKGIADIYSGTVMLDEGVAKLNDGARALANGTGELDSNSSALRDGASQLADGANQLNDGAIELRDGAGKLNDGTGELKDGTKELYDGSIELDNGVKELLDGVSKFDEEGIKKIYEAFDGDLSDFTDRLEAIKEAGSSYKTFGGSADDVDSSVKFIIKTDSIKSL